MLALLSVWLGLASLAYAIVIVVWRRLFTDLGVTVTLYAAIFSLTFAGLTLWNLRKRDAVELGVREQRIQAWIGSALSVISVACIYLLIAQAEVHPRSGEKPSRLPLLCKQCFRVQVPQQPLLTDQWHASNLCCRITGAVTNRCSADATSAAVERVFLYRGGAVDLPRR